MIRTTIRTTTAEHALEDTAAAFADGLGPLAAWGSDEIRLADGTVLVAGLRRATDGGNLVGCWRIHHIGRGVIASYDLTPGNGLRLVEPAD